MNKKKVIAHSDQSPQSSVLDGEDGISSIQSLRKVGCDQLYPLSSKALQTGKSKEEPLKGG